jgi:hypothetical protein
MQEPETTFMESQPTPSNTAPPPESASLAAIEPQSALPYQAAVSRRDIGLAVGAGVAYLALFVITLRIPFGQTSVLVATLISLGLVLLFTVSAARALRRPLALVLWTLLTGAISLPYVLIPVLIARFPTWTGWQNVFNVFRRYAQTMAHVPGLHGLMLILFAVCLGVWLSRLMREMKILLPIAVVLACMDLYVVFGGGLVTQAHTGKAPVAQAAMRSLTGPSNPKTGAAPMQLSVGFADFLFIALFFACLARFRVPSGRTFLVLCVTLVFYLTLVYVFRVDLPALVPIAVVVVGMNLRQFRYERSEAFALLYAGLIVAAILGGMLFLSHR